MSLKQSWLEEIIKLSTGPDFVTCGARRIIRDHRWSIPGPLLLKDDTVQLETLAYGKAKLRMLEGYYVHEPSIAAANELWEKRKSSKKYGSVSFSCYNHFRKGKTAMGPCLQSVVLSQFRKDRETFTLVDVYYRTTEIVKKFSADLVLVRDSLLPRFDFSGAPVKQINFVFSNVTVHPMYWPLIIPHYEDWEYALWKVKANNPHFHLWIVKWTARYILPEYRNGIEKFAQAMRTRQGFIDQLSKRDFKKLEKYIRKELA